MPVDKLLNRNETRSMRRENPPQKGPVPEIKPPRVAARIKAAPKIRQAYWCDFPRDAQLPEMWKTRPVLVLSYKNTLFGPCLVAPFSTDPQIGNPWALPASISFDGRKTWVVCNHLYTVAPSRLSTFPGGKIPRFGEEEFTRILALVLQWMPRLPVPVAVGEAVEEANSAVIAGLVAEKT